MVSDIIIVVMLILFTLIGALRGFLRTILNLVAAFFSALIANWLSAPVGTWFYTTFVRQSLLSNLEHEITQSGFPARWQTLCDRSPTGWRIWFPLHSRHWASVWTTCKKEF